MTRQIIAILHAITQAIQSLVAAVKQRQAQSSADDIAVNPGAEWLRRFGKREAAKTDAGKPDHQ